jgi:DNA-binding NarL/FixJ family response regulator
MRVLLVDNHPVVRLGIRTLLDKNTAAEDVLETGDAEEALYNEGSAPGCGDPRLRAWRGYERP